MKIILQRDEYYCAIDLEISRWSDRKHNIEDTLDCIQNNSFTNMLIIQCTSEKEILEALREYPSYKLVEFIDDKNNLYEYW